MSEQSSAGQEFNLRPTISVRWRLQNSQKSAASIISFLSLPVVYDSTSEPSPVNPLLHLFGANMKSLGQRVRREPILTHARIRTQPVKHGANRSRRAAEQEAHFMQGMRDDQVEQLAVALCWSTPDTIASLEFRTGARISGKRPWGFQRLQPASQSVTSNRLGCLVESFPSASWHSGRLWPSLLQPLTNGKRGASSTDCLLPCWIRSGIQTHSPLYLYMAAKRKCISSMMRKFLC